jgi:hypothetical protein
MNILRQIIREITGMFIDDGSLALFAVILIATISAAVEFAGLPPLAGGVLLLAGCLGVLTESVHRAARQRR